jgi:hypothetical protein
VVTFFQAATVSMLGNGEMTLFWMDNWIKGSNISCLAPMVFRCPKASTLHHVAEALQERAWVHQIVRPRTMRLLTEFISLWAIVE